MRIFPDRTQCGEIEGESGEEEEELSLLLLLSLSLSCSITLPPAIPPSTNPG